MLYFTNDKRLSETLNNKNGGEKCYWENLMSAVQHYIASGLKRLRSLLVDLNPQVTFIRPPLLVLTSLWGY